MKEKSAKHKKGFTFSKLREAFSLHKKEEQSGQNQSVTFCPLVEHDENVLNKFFAIKQVPFICYKSYQLCRAADLVFLE